MVSFLEHAQHCTLVLAPNRSVSWKQAKWVVMGIGTIVLTIAVAWSFVGAWLVLPFAGFEVALLALLMHHVNRLCYRQQVLTITADHVCVEQGFEHPQSSLSLHRSNLHLQVTEPDSPLDRTRLTLVSPACSVEIGAFLNQDDLKLARQHLHHCGIMVCSNHWWKQSAA